MMQIEWAKAAWHQRDTFGPRTACSYFNTLCRKKSECKDISDWFMSLLGQKPGLRLLWDDLNPFLCSSIRWLVCSSIQQSLVQSFIPSSVHSFVHSSFCECFYSFDHLYVCTLVDNDSIVLKLCMCLRDALLYRFFFLLELLIVY